MVEFENINYEELKHMNLTRANYIVGMFKRFTWLNNAHGEINGVKYQIDLLHKSEWDDEDGTQYTVEYGLLCKCDDNYDVVEKYDICVVNLITKSYSFVFDYYYDNDIKVNQIILK